MRNKLLILTFLFLFFGVRPVFADSVVINEIMANPNDGTEWVELYNTTNQVVNLANWKLKDSNTLTSDDLTLSGQINPSEFVIFDNNRSWLNNTGSETVILLDNNNQTIDSYTYSGTTKGKTYGRQPDGSIWIANLDPSKGSSNGGQSSPTPTAIQTQTPSPIPTITNQSSSFTLLNVPSQINSDQVFSASVNLALPSNPNTNFYLKGAFRKTDGSNYFGLTKVAGSWVKNSSSYSSQYPIMTDSSGNWSGNLEVKPDSDDSGFTGTGDYLFKVGKYNSLDTSPSVSWSNNESTITIISTESSDQDSTSTSTSNSPLSTTNSPTPSVKAATTISSQPKSSDKLIYQIASVAAATASAIPEVKTEVKNQRQTNPFLVIGLILIFAGAGTVGYIYLKPYEKIRIWFRR